MSATDYADTLNDLHKHLSHIDTTDGLDTLPAWSVVLDSDQVAWQKDPTGYWFTGGLMSATSADRMRRHLPVVLLWRGDDRS
ncbi:hypothetical protein [Actinomyces faecalis]|uniref:hypothetical protein n=1 Tax=Actinomyces faecalis TaxID=2722820 RepID=UPI00155264E3|nr:hypothetical protein [Actinomyces faecalis]